MTAHSVDRAAHVRHELRTPLNHIIGYGELLIDEFGDEFDDAGLAAATAMVDAIIAHARALVQWVNAPQVRQDFAQGAHPVSADPQGDIAVRVADIQALCTQLHQQTAHTGQTQSFGADIDHIAHAASRFLHLVLHGVAEVAPSAVLPPIDPAINPALEPLAPIVADPASAPVKGTILVVDDNDANRDMLSRRVEKLGYTVLVASGGLAALAAVQQQVIDLILLDLMMPEVDGYEVLKRLKNNPAQRDIPVLMISALDEMDSVIRCIELGAADYLFKPFDPVLLRARIVACLERKHLQDEVKHHVLRMERELELARAIQLSMVPTNFDIATPASGLTVYAMLEPAYEVGGDLYDFFWITPRRFCIVIADVSDKGASAALFMARTKTAVRLTALHQGKVLGDAVCPAALLQTIDQTLCQDNPQAMFATLFLALIDSHTGVVDWCNAGHNPPCWLPQGGVVQELSGDSGIPMGIMDDFERVSHRLTLSPGDSLLAYTDGVSEAMDSAHAMYGTERLMAVLAAQNSAFAAANPSRIISAVHTSVKAFTGPGLASDDIAMVCCTWLPG